MTVMKDKVQIIRDMFEAYRMRDRAKLERILSDDFRFTSPYDDRISKADYFARCWPMSLDYIATNVIERIVVTDDEAFVQYQATTKDGTVFRNTELFRFAGDQVAEVNVFFGASYKDGVFVPQKPGD